jgi:hypothetical protein
MNSEFLLFAHISERNQKVLISGMSSFQHRFHCREPPKIAFFQDCGLMCRQHSWSVASTPIWVVATIAVMPGGCGLAFCQFNQEVP